MNPSSNDIGKQESQNEFLRTVPVFFLEVSSSGEICASNEHSIELIGKNPVGLDFRDVIFDSSKGIDPFALASTNKTTLLSVQTFTGLPQSLYCRFTHRAGNVFILGAVDFKEHEMIRLRAEKISQELGNKTRELQKSNAELERLNKLKTQFLGMAAHDLRSPAGVIESLSGFLIDEVLDKLDAEHQEFINMIHSRAKHMRQIISDFLDVAVIESGNVKIEPVMTPLRKIIASSMESVSISSQRKQVSIKVLEDAADVTIFVDPSKILQVLTNLLSNAIDHSYENSSVLIKWEIIDKLIEIRVEDFGVGISEDVQSKLFKSFEKGLTRKTGNEGSTGLGLVISKKIAEAHGGGLKVQSQENVGSVFTLVLPFETNEDQSCANEP